MTDLLALTAELVDIPSVSHDETALADRVEAELAGPAHLDGRPLRRHRGGPDHARTAPPASLLAGHLDTVPPFERRRARASRATRCGASVPWT